MSGKCGGIGETNWVSVAEFKGRFDESNNNNNSERLKERTCFRGDGQLCDQNGG